MGQRRLGQLLLPAVARPALWTVDLAYLSLPSMLGASFSISPAGTLIVFAQGLYGRYNASQLLASLDGGLTWGVCALDVGFTARWAPALTWVNGNRLLVTGGQRRGFRNITAEVWQASLDFGDVAQVNSACGLTHRTEDVIGLPVEVISRILHQNARALPSAKVGEHKRWSASRRAYNNHRNDREKANNSAGQQEQADSFN